MTSAHRIAELTAVLRRNGVPVPVYDVGTALASPAEPCVVLLTDWNAGVADELSRHAWSGPGWLVPVRFDGGLTLTGPALGPNARCCLACAEVTRLRHLGPDLVDGPVGPGLGGRVAAIGLPVLAAVVLDAARCPDRYDGRLTAARIEHSTVSTHSVRPRPQGCDVCAPVPVDSPEDARVDLTPVRAGDRFGLRAENPRTTGAAMRAELVDWRHGPVTHLSRFERSPLPWSVAEIAGVGPGREAGYGRSVTFADAERVALFEAAERYTGGRPHAHRTVLEASFDELGPDRAVDPRRLGLPDLPRPGSAYTPQTSTRWVYGWSFTRRTAVAVPEHVAYWNVAGPTAARFVHETSSGCGLGNSLVEAVLYGLFEVAERDAFLMAWYARTPLHPVVLPDEDPVLPHLADRLAAVGYDLTLFDATNDLDVPAVLALASRRDPHPAAPRAYFAAGAHPDPRRAMRSAAVEVSLNVFSTTEQTRTDPDLLARERLLPMLGHPELVRTMADHVALHTLPEARERYEFLRRGAPVDWRQLWPGRPAPVDDLAELLTTTTERLAGLGLEVIAVDQSDPVLHARTGLRSAKVIIPGTLPMTFGHVNRRTSGLRRVVDVPHRMGRLARSIRYEDLPLHPHPFP
jgi:ribosomal protein S12 methylthiotransferase accessory factor